jgi:hypothetical protein
VEAQAPARTKPSSHAEPFFSRMSKREKRPLGDLSGRGAPRVNWSTGPARKGAAVQTAKSKPHWAGRPLGFPP